MSYGRNVTFVGLAFGILCTLGCSDSSLIRSDFATTYACPSNKVEVQPTPEDPDAYRVTGCGFDFRYDCGETLVPDGYGHVQNARECGARQRMEYEATDGTAHGAWFGDEIRSNDAMSVEAVLASAAHDLPCDRASLKVVGTDEHGFGNVVDGCGQRITYQITDVGDQPTPSLTAPVRRHKYIVVGRLALSGPKDPPR